MRVWRPLANHVAVRPLLLANQECPHLFHAQRQQSGEQEARAAHDERVDRVAAEQHLQQRRGTLAITSCGITMKKLKMPMYTPILRDGTLPASNAYGSERIDAQAKPTPTMDSSSQRGSRITRNDSSAAPPSHRLIRWLTRMPKRRTMQWNHDGRQRRETVVGAEQHAHPVRAVVVGGADGVGRTEVHARHRGVVCVHIANSASQEKNCTGISSRMRRGMLSMSPISVPQGRSSRAMRC